MKKLIFLCIAIVVLAASCKTVRVAKQEAYPQMYEETPLSIVIAPPLNLETAANAGDFYLSTIAVPTTFHGFYVFPVPIVMDILKNEGIYNTIHELPKPAVAQRFYELMGADATLFTTVLRWDKKYRVIAGSVEVQIAYRLVSGKTGELLWSHSKLVVVDTSSGGSGSLIADAIMTAIETAITDFVPVARQANALALIACPYGKYHPQYLQDKEMEVEIAKTTLEETGRPASEEEGETNE